MNGNKKTNRPFYQKKQVDELTKETYSWLGRIFVFIKKNKIRAWHLIFTGAYLVGALSTLIFTASLEIYPTSQAAGETAILALSPTAKTVYINDSFMLDLNINTTAASPGHKVVAAKAVVNFDPNTFELLSVDTTASSFASGNTCIYNSKPCEIIKNESGKVTITLAKPTPGVAVSSSSPAKMAVLTFRAKALINPTSNNITMSFTSGSYADSDIIFDDGLGTDILTGVTNAKVTVTPITPTQCSDGTPLNTCSFGKPYWCDGSGNLINNQCGAAQHNCGCPAVTPFCEATGACSAKCSDGTAFNTCSATKPKYCNTSANLTNQCTTCGCPAVTPFCEATGACSAKCSDGTAFNTCSATKPYWCDATGTLFNNQCGAAQHNCGCPAGLTCQANGSCSAPTCTPNGCNANCPIGCTVAQDPDCACQGGNSCCGIVCTNTNDSDCPPIIDVKLTPQTTNIAIGQTLNYGISATNNTDQLQVFAAAIQVLNSEKTATYRDDRFSNINLGPRASLNTNRTLPVPLNTNLVGRSFVVRIFVGTSPTNIYDSDEFIVTVTAQ